MKRAMHVLIPAAALALCAGGAVCGECRADGLPPKTCDIRDFGASPGGTSAGTTYRARSRTNTYAASRLWENEK